MSSNSFNIIPMEFKSKGIVCRGDLYLPDHDTTSPVVIMAHGFGAEQSMGLGEYAKRFVQRQLAVFTFDYRGFGRSDGTPRNLVDPFSHVEDWKAAISFVRGLSYINPDKMALWGTSFSGGHVLVCAAADPSIKAVVSQVPFVDPISSMRKLGFKYQLKAFPHLLSEFTRTLMFRSPHYIKIIGKTDEFAVMNTEDAYEGFSSLLPDDTSWENRCPARILWLLPLYRPMAHAKKIKCPVLVIGAEYDSLIDISAVKKTAKRIPKGEIVVYPIKHFEIYSGDWLEKAAGLQMKFLEKHLLQ